jgi:hypothetical protein
MRIRIRRTIGPFLSIGCAFALAHPLGAQVLALNAVPERRYEDERAAFVAIRQVLVDAEENVFILDTQTAGVHVFGADGVYRGQIGRSGSGPGEFRSVGWMG